MWSVLSLSTPKNLSHDALLRRCARLMLRHAHAEQSSLALPVLRRVLAAKAVPEQRLSALFSVRESLQLKHMLRTLATELGFDSWEACKQQVETLSPVQLDRYRFDLGAFNNYERIWFPDEASALRWQQESGGYVVRYGEQAVGIVKPA